METIHWIYISHCQGLPGDSAGKESTCSAGDLGLIPWRRAWHPTPVLLPGESHGQRSLAGYGPWGRRESDTTERLSTAQPLSVWFSLPLPPQISQAWLPFKGPTCPGVRTLRRTPVPVSVWVGWELLEAGREAAATLRHMDTVADLLNYSVGVKEPQGPGVCFSHCEAVPVAAGTPVTKVRGSKNRTEHPSVLAGSQPSHLPPFLTVCSELQALALTRRQTPKDHLHNPHHCVSQLHIDTFVYTHTHTHTHTHARTNTPVKWPAKGF